MMLSLLVLHVIAAGRAAAHQLTGVKLLIEKEQKSKCPAVTLLVKPQTNYWPFQLLTGIHRDVVVLLQTAALNTYW